MQQRIVTAVTKHPLAVLAVVAAVTLLAAAQIVTPRGELLLDFDPSSSRLFPADDPAVDFYQHVRRLFGSDETLVLALVDDDGVFTRPNLEAVQRLSERLQELDGVHHVVSLANALNIRGRDEELEIRPFIRRVPDDAAALAAIRAEALANPIYAGNLVSEDGRATAIFVYLEDIGDKEFLARDLDRKVAAIAEEERGDAEAWLTGAALVKAETTRMGLADTARTTPLIGAVMALIAFLTFRSLRGVIVPLATVGIALVWSLGAIAASGRPITIIGMIIPAIIQTIGFAYTVHVVSAYYDALRAGAATKDPDPRRALVRETLEEVTLPVLLTGLTTIAGFLALTLSPLGAIREFGVFCVIAVSATVVGTLSFAPALLTLLPVPKAARDSGVGSRFDGAARALAEFDVRNRRGILLAGGAVAALALFGLTQIRVGMDQITNFASDHPLRVHFDAINESLQGSNLFYVVVRADYRDAFHDPANLRLLAELQDWLESQPEIGGTTSLVDYVKLINRGFHANDPTHLAIPDSSALIGQLLFFGANDELETVVDSRHQTTSVLVRSKVIDSGEVAVLVDRIEEHLAELPAHLDGSVTGNSVLVIRNIDAISRGQAITIGAAFVLIYALLAALFTSFRVGALALVPNALPVLIYFGTLGLVGVTLNPTTSLVACIVLGIAVDDTIHFMARFSRSARVHADERLGVVDALVGVWKPVTCTTLALCLGFSMLMMSEMRNQLEFGALAAFTLFVAWVVDVTLTPALASGMRVVTLWDVLGLDLGEDPQLSIPLFRGLRKSQARIVALMMDIQTYPKGHPLFRIGDPGDEAFVVLDGELQVSLPREGRNHEVATVRRGDVIGEVALFHGARSADVEALSEVRLLRLEEDDLARLRRRYPRIGAQVLTNLSRILADRLAAANRERGR